MSKIILAGLNENLILGPFVSTPHQSNVKYVNTPRNGMNSMQELKSGFVITLK